MRVWPAAIVAALLFLPSPLASGQSITPRAEEDLSQRVTNPIEFLMKMILENEYSPSLWDSHGEGNQVQGEFVVPFTAFDRKNLGRIKIFFTTSNPDGSHGLSSAEIVDLVLFERSWGTFGVGGTAHVTTQSSNELGTIAPGPAVGAVVKHGRWQYGLFNQNFFSDTFAETELQPILSYEFNRHWSAEIGNAEYTYDWKKHRVTLIPLSGQLNRIESWRKQDIQLFVRGQYNAKNDSGSDKWTISAGITLIIQPYAGR